MDLTNLTPAKQKLVADAAAAGYTVNNSNDMHVDIVKWSKHAKPRALSGLRIWQNGTAIDITIDLSVAKSIRNVNDQRAFLGL